MDKIAVLVPCFNEEMTIGQVVREWRLALPHATVYVYDNNSTDRTAVLASEAGAIVRRVAQAGKGNVIRRALQEVDAECYVMVDGDNTYPVDVAPIMIESCLEGGADMVVGDRLAGSYFVQNDRKFHNFGNRLVRWLVKYLFGSNTKIDVLSGYRVLSYRFAKSFPVLSCGFEIETEMTIQAIDKNFQMASVAVQYRNRLTGSQSKLSTFKDGFKILRTMVALLKDCRPLCFFNGVAVIFAVVATMLSVMFPPPPHILTSAAAVSDLGAACSFSTFNVFSIFGYFAAILSFFVGLILHGLKRKERREFELWLHHAYHCHCTAKQLAEHVLCSVNSADQL